MSVSRRRFICLHALLSDGFRIPGVLEWLCFCGNGDFQRFACSAGFPIPGTQIRIVDPESKAELPDGQQGLVQARGPGVMAGYYNDEENTSKAFAPGNGWFDTGDLGWRAPGERLLFL